VLARWLFGAGTIIVVSIDSNVRGDEAMVSGADLGAELARGGVPLWNVWLGYLSLGGAMSYAELTDTVAGSRLTPGRELYLMMQASNY